MKRLGRYLKTLRKSNGLTLAEVAHTTDISIGYLSEIEQGKRGSPHPNILLKLAKTYGVPIEAIFEAAGFMSKQEENPAVFSKKDDVEWAIAAILRDISFSRFINKGMVKYMPLEMKINLIRTYEATTGKKLLPWESTEQD